MWEFYDQKQSNNKVTDTFKSIEKADFQQDCVTGIVLKPAHIASMLLVFLSFCQKCFTNLTHYIVTLIKEEEKNISESPSLTDFRQICVFTRNFFNEENSTAKLGQYSVNTFLCVSPRDQNTGWCEAWTCLCKVFLICTFFINSPHKLECQHVRLNILATRKGDKGSLLSSTPTKL